MRILITGAAGFVGSCLTGMLHQDGRGGIRALVRHGRDVRHIARPGLQIAECDMSNPEALDTCLRDIDVVVHLAGVTMARDRQGYCSGNGELTAGLVEAVNRNDRVSRFVYVSSQAAAGPCATPPGLHGHETPRPVSWYGWSKLQAEREVSRLNTHWTIIRPPMIYGPRDTAFLPLFQAARLGIVPLQDGGRALMSIVHVQDVCAQILAAMDGSQPSGRIYYPSDGTVRSWKEICLTIARSCGCRVIGIVFPSWLIWPIAAVNGLTARMGGPIRYLNPDKFHEARQAGWLCSGENASQELGWMPTVELEQGMKNVAIWYRRNGWLKGPLAFWSWRSQHPRI